MRPWILTASSMHSALWTVKAFCFLQPKWLRPISAKFRDFSVPIVVVDCYYDELDYDCVLIGNIRGRSTPQNYLIQCGHTKRGLLSLEPRHQQLLRTRRRLLQSAPCKRYQHLASICPPGFPYLGRGLPRHAAPSRVESSDRRCLLCRQ